MAIIYFLFPQVNGTEMEYEFEEITLERVSILVPTAMFNLKINENMAQRKSIKLYQK